MHKTINPRSVARYYAEDAIRAISLGDLQDARTALLDALRLLDEAIAHTRS